MKVYYNCPYCGKLATADELNSEVVKGLGGLTYKCQCKTCKNVTLVIICPFTELDSELLKKLDLTRYFRS